VDEKTLDNVLSEVLLVLGAFTKQIVIWGGFRSYPINFVTGHCCGPHLQVANSGPCDSRCLVPVAISKAARKVSKNS